MKVDNEKLGKTKNTELKVVDDVLEGIIWSEGVAGSKIWMGSILVKSKVKSNAQHHETSDTVHYVLKGKATFYYGEQYKETACLNEGDFIYIPPYHSYKFENSKESDELHIITTMTPVFKISYLDKNETISINSEENKEAKISVIRSAELDNSTDQTKNMPRKTAVQVTNLWIGRVTGEVGMDSGKHHHGESETVGFIISGTTNLLYGEGYRSYVQYKPGDYLRVPLYLPHIEQNPSESETVEFLTARNPENIVVNIK